MTPQTFMTKFFHKRTKEHIDRVVDNAKKLKDYFKGDFNSFIGQVIKHDISKYDSDEYVPYIWLTWFYKCKNEGADFKYPKGVEKIVSQATNHHVQHNTHHPECHKTPSKMSDSDIGEMVCDWHAMSQELGSSTVDWADRNIGTKWNFNQNQSKKIYDMIHILEGNKVMAELSKKQKEYRKFFRQKLEEFEVNSPAELSEENKKKFFNSIERGWTKEKKTEANYFSDAVFDTLSAGFPMPKEKMIELVQNYGGRSQQSDHMLKEIKASKKPNSLRKKWNDWVRNELVRAIWW